MQILVGAVAAGQDPQAAANAAVELLGEAIYSFRLQQSAAGIFCANWGWVFIWISTALPLPPATGPKPRRWACANRLGGTG